MTTTKTTDTSNPVGDELGAFDLEAGASTGAPDRTSSSWISDVPVVRQQIRILTALHKPNGGLSAPAYAVYAVLLLSWCAVPTMWISFSVDGSAAVCGEGRIELDGTGARGPPPARWRLAVPRWQPLVLIRVEWNRPRIVRVLRGGGTALHVG